MHMHKRHMIRSAAGAVIDMIERRTLLSAVLGADGTLTVTGTGGNDRINVNVNLTAEGDETKLDAKVTVNGVVQQFNAIPNGDKLIVDGLAGNDTIVARWPTSSHRAFLATTIRGGDGNDFIED